MGSHLLRRLIDLLRAARLADLSIVGIMFLMVLFAAAVVAAVVVEPAAEEPEALVTAVVAGGLVVEWAAVAVKVADGVCYYSSLTGQHCWLVADRLREKESRWSWSQHVFSQCPPMKAVVVRSSFRLNDGDLTLQEILGDAVLFKKLEKNRYSWNAGMTCRWLRKASS